MNKAIFYNGIEIRLVPHEPDDGYRFYVSEDGVIGLRIAPDGTETLLHPHFTTSPNSKNKNDARRKQRYLLFRHAFGCDCGILVSRAVYLAWVGPIPAGAECIDHLNGITTDNRFTNLDPVTHKENNRRARILRALRASGIDPASMTPADLLRTFANYTVTSGTLPRCAIEPPSAKYV